VGTYSAGNAFVVAVIKKHDFPTAPSPTTTHLIADMFSNDYGNDEKLLVKLENLYVSYHT